MAEAETRPLGDDLRELARYIPATLRAHAERLAVRADELELDLRRAQAQEQDRT
jgi:hypothetical protein